MNLNEAIKTLKTAGYLVEMAEVNDVYDEGEAKGRFLLNYPNKFNQKEALAFYVMGCNRYDSFNLDKYEKSIIKDWSKDILKGKPYKWHNQFNKMWKTIYGYMYYAPIKLYRGIVLTGDEELDKSDLGVCWTFERNVAKEWALGIVRNYEFDRVMNRIEPPDNIRPIILTATTDVSNCRLAFSMWLAGRFNNRPEYEIRIKDPEKLELIKTLEI